MGSLSSRPSVPAVQPQVIFVPAQTTTQSTLQTSSSSSGGDASAGSGSDGAAAAAQTASEARTSSLLGRNRGRLGTIQTSLRGLLGLADTSGQRKTLLGE